eukprot:TRINITY_DN4276_c0_g1_i2.p1 TRINITY_DN4276_c0_g1~~TRINITY_DN4276_c0_g1_i2.p1  ORF type:complete len:335 (+),score=93.33 TRINITY_DN4276_c0_g1_i2:89-1006(+)
MASLFKKPIGELVPKNQQLVIIPSSATVMDALRILKEKNIYSAPVRDQSKGNYYGFLDMLDIVVFLVCLIEEKLGKDPANHKTLAHATSKLDFATAKNVADLSSANPMVPLRSSDPLSEAFRLFQSTGTHRVPILKDEGVADLASVLTQIDVISWLATNIKDIPNGKKTLKDLNVNLDKVISVETTARTFDALKLLADNKITGVAIVNADGSLLSNLSAKDLKEVQPEELLMWMNRTALEYVQMVRSKQINVSFPAFSCHLHTTLEEIVMKLNVLRVHRLYITDESNMPIGVLSLGDLFKLVFTE